MYGSVGLGRDLGREWGENDPTDFGAVLGSAVPLLRKTTELSGFVGSGGSTNPFLPTFLATVFNA
jgi:hypothetical protein